MADSVTTASSAKRSTPTVSHHWTIIPSKTKLVVNFGGALAFRCRSTIAARSYVCPSSHVTGSRISFPVIGHMNAVGTAVASCSARARADGDRIVW